MIVYNTKLEGGIIMYYLVDNELESFIEKYFPMWGQDILTVSYEKFEDKIKYTVNGHYILTIKN